MSKNISDQNGRALEFKIVHDLISILKIDVPESTLLDQKRDEIKYQQLNGDLQIRFEDSSKKIVQWLIDTFRIDKFNDTQVIRIKDGDSKKGDVTDIRITYNKQTLNLSIKHNHNAIKHQRPSALPTQAGFDKKSQIASKYRIEYQTVLDTFNTLVKKQFPGISLYNEIKFQDENFINDHLYSPMCDIVNDFINKQFQVTNASSFFTFLVGSINFYKIVVYNDKVYITKFSEIEMPINCKAEKLGKSYIILKFSNGWNLKMRLHTASSRIQSNSLKFDTQPIEIQVTQLVL